MQNSSILNVNLSDIHHNLKSMIKSAGHVMVMVKANGYGTDQLLLSKFIHTLGCKEIPFLGVAHVSEAVYLRESGITLPIFVISVTPSQAQEVVHHDLSASVSTWEEAEALNREGQKARKKIPVHLHLDTGMNRSGIAPSQAVPLYQHIMQLPYLYLEGVWTHFVGAESPDFESYTQGQITAFKRFLDSVPHYPRWIHAANSAGVVRFSLPFCNLARIGLGSFGYGPRFSDMVGALSLTTSLSTIKMAKKGETVGYLREYTISSENARIGVIPFGYFDGFPRSISGKGYVLIRGKKAPMIGKICMDFMMIDLSAIPQAQIGDEVILFDADLPLELVASWAQTDVREILVSLPSRVKRLWKGMQHDCANDSERFSTPFVTLKESQATR